MRGIIIDPDQMTVSDTTVDLDDFRAIQKEIGNRSYEVISLAAGARLYVDEAARIRSNRPTRFILPASKDQDGGPLAVYGRALMVLDGNLCCPEVIFPKEHRVTTLDGNWQTLGCFVSTAAGRDPSNLNFQAVLSDARFVAATRVVLTTFEAHILNAVPSHWLCPIVELEIDRAHLGDALDLYNHLLAKFGYTAEAEEEAPEGIAEATPENLTAAFVEFRSWAASTGELFGPELYAPAYLFPRPVPLGGTGVEAEHPHSLYWLCYGIGGRFFISRVEPITGGRQMKTEQWLRDADGWGQVDVSAWDVEQREANTAFTNNCIVQRNVCGFTEDATKGVFIVGDSWAAAGCRKRKLTRSIAFLIEAAKTGRGRALEIEG